MGTPVGSKSLTFEDSMTWPSLTKYLLSLLLCQAVNKFYAHPSLLVLVTNLLCL